MAKAKARRTGRSKGSRNRGYFFRDGRGWVANVNGRRVPLEYENGDRMRSENIPATEVRAAYLRCLAVPEAPDDASAVSFDAVLVSGQPCPARWYSRQ